MQGSFSQKLDQLPKDTMGFVGKWYGFGLSSAYDAGVRARERGDLDEAITQFSAALNDPIEAEFKAAVRRTLANALGRKAKLLLDSNPSEASDLLKNALEIEPKFADLWLALARAQADAQDSLKSVKTAVEINPNYGEAYLHLASLHALQGEFEEAASCLARGLEGNPRLQGADATEAGLLLASKNPLAAQTLRSIRPLTPEAQLFMDEGDLFGMKRRWQDAEQCYARALDLAPSFADLRCRRAQALMELNRLDEAEQELSSALNLNPRYAEALAILGVVYKRSDRLEEAVASFQRSLEADPTQTIALSELARLGHISASLSPGQTGSSSA